MSPEKSGRRIERELTSSDVWENISTQACPCYAQCQENDVRKQKALLGSYTALNLSCGMSDRR